MKLINILSAVLFVITYITCPSGTKEIKSEKQPTTMTTAIPAGLVSLHVILMKPF